MNRKKICMVPLGDVQAFKDLYYESQDRGITLKEFLCQAPALSTEPVDNSWIDWNMNRFNIVTKHEPPTQGLYRPPGMNAAPVYTDNKTAQKLQEKHKKPSHETTETTETGKEQETSSEPQTIERGRLPVTIENRDAVRLAYAREIESASSFLRAHLSALIFCDKLVVEHLWKEMAAKAHLEPVVLTVPVEDDSGLMPRSLRQRQLAQLKEFMRDLKSGHLLVIPHLDLLAGGSDSNLSTESRELIELVYEHSNRLILAFADRSIDIPEVLAARFAVRLLISGISRTVVYPEGIEKPIGEALITADEAAHFKGFDPEGLYKNVAGMNPIRLRHAIKYAVKEHAGADTVSVLELYQALRAFKAQTSANFEIPDVSFNDIGGYDTVKTELLRAISLMTESYNLPDEKLQRELIPRGFIFFGPPGTGKTLFAKAVANKLNATIQVVSGPEVTDMYVGESERKVRELFAEARRNAPAVLVFDEFDSIAAKRSGREDGGSRAGNAIVAQILTEMDGFRPDVPILVIGTTNRLDIIDEALLRPSRFKAIGIRLPDKTARLAIASVHAKHFKISVSPQLLEIIASATDGFNGDEIRSLFRDACVGKYCEVPPKETDALQFGRLVGALRQTAEQHAATLAEHRTSAMQTVSRRGERPQPTGPMISLIDEEIQQPTDES